MRDEERFITRLWDQVVGVLCTMRFELDSADENTLYFYREDNTPFASVRFVEEMIDDGWRPGSLKGAELRLSDGTLIRETYVNTRNGPQHPLQFLEGFLSILRYPQAVPQRVPGLLKAVRLAQKTEQSTAR